MKALHTLPFLFLTACAQPEDSITQKWLSERDDRESVSLYTGIFGVLPTASESVADAVKDFAALEKGTKQLGRPLEERQTATWTTYIIRAEKDGAEGFVILSKQKQGPHLWSGRFTPRNWFDKKE
jgi:hypothetical protein